MDRLLGTCHSSAASRTFTSGEELTEDDVFWTYDVDDSQENHYRRRSPEPTVSDRRRSIAPISGILAVLPEWRSDYNQVPYRKPIQQSRAGQSILRRAAGRQEKGSGNRTQKQQSGPVSVPLLSIAAARERSRRFMEAKEEDMVVLPPHEIVARGSGVSPKTTFSVLEGAGRTLKGRDLRQVRNAVFRRTGFID